jgi:hypothetical protein
MPLRQSLRWCPSLRQPRRLTPLYALPRHDSTASTLPPAIEVPVVSVSPDKILYRGPLTATFKRLKVFSLSSLSLCLTTAPLMFAIETSLPWSARAALAGTAVATSSVSTCLIAWAGRSYVTALRVTKAPTDDAIEQLEITTLTLRLKPRITRVRTFALALCLAPSTHNMNCRSSTRSSSSPRHDRSRNGNSRSWCYCHRTCATRSPARRRPLRRRWTHRATYWDGGS